MKFRLFALAGVSAMSMAAGAWAQAPAAGQEAGLGQVSTLDEVVVTTRRREELVQDVPLSVNVITADTAAKLNIRDFNEVQTLVPGLQLRNEANGIGGNAQIRGVQYDINTSAPPTVGFYLNDAPTEASVVLQTMYDVGLISVERGPQGTLRGLATPSGSIVVTTRKPNLNEFGGYVSGTVNDISGANLNGAIGVPLIKGIAALRIAGATDQNQGNRVSTIEPDGDRRPAFNKTQSGRVSLLVTPLDWLRVEGVYQRMDRSTRGLEQYESFSNVNPAAPLSNPVIRPKDRLSIQETGKEISNTFRIYNWRVEAAQLGQRLIYQGAENVAYVHANTNTDFANFLNGRDTRQDTTTRSNQRTHEVRLQNEDRLFNAFDYVVGYFNSRLAVRTDLNQQTAVFLPTALGGGLATIANTPITATRASPVKEESFFGNLTAHIGENTEISGGLRHIDFQNSDSVLIIAGNSRITEGRDKKGTIYVASLKHNFTENFMAYAMTGSSLRPGPNVTGDFSLIKSPLQISFQELPAETSKSYEIGFKSTWLDDRLRFNVAAFHQKFKNYPYRSPTGVYYRSFNASVQNGVVTTVEGVSSFNFVAPVPVEVDGFETEVNFAVTPEWNVGLVTAYALGKIKDGVVACNDLNRDGVDDALTQPPTLAQLAPVVGANNLSTCVVNQRSSYQPPFSATLTSEYRRSVNSQADGFVRGLFSYYGKSLGDPTYEFDQVKAYGLLNLFAGVGDPDGAWELSFFAKNVLNTVKVTQRGLPAVTNYQRLTLPTFTAQAASFTSPYTQITTTAPREFGVTFRAAFGSR